MVTSLDIDRRKENPTLPILSYSIARKVCKSETVTISPINVDAPLAKAAVTLNFSYMDEGARMSIPNEVFVVP